MRILLWLAVPVACAALAALWAAWYARPGASARTDREPVAYGRDGRSGRASAPSRREERFAAAVRRPLRAPVVRARQEPARSSGVVVRRAER